MDDVEVNKKLVGKRLKPLDLDEWKKEFDGAWDYDILKEKRQIFISKTAFENLKQRIKQACEFYLRYKDKPELLVKEHPELLEDVVVEDMSLKDVAEVVVEVSWFDRYKYNTLLAYNEWLFKLAFKSV